jgi:sugar phosphate isomerase/epimerase
MKRRDFILASAALLAACSRHDGGAAMHSGAAPPLGLQLYTLRDLMERDVAATLALVAKTGYREVEFAGYFDHSPAQLRGMLDDVGLAAPSTHIGADQFAEDAARVIDLAAEMGHRYVVVPWLDEAQRSLDDYRRHSENFNRWAAACAGAGLQFAYHNHDFEFIETDGEIPYDLLLAETDAGLVRMELDLAWATKGKADIVAYFEAWPGRFPLLHLKDMDADGNESDIGTGSVAFDTILAHAKAAGVKHGFVERDHPDDSKSSIERNFAAMMPIWSSHVGQA